MEQKAVSDKNSKVKLTMDENKSMAGHRISTIDSEKSFVYVDSITLDDYFKNNLQIINKFNIFYYIVAKKTI